MFPAFPRLPGDLNHIKTVLELGILCLELFSDKAIRQILLKRGKSSNSTRKIHEIVYSKGKRRKYRDSDASKGSKTPANRYLDELQRYQSLEMRNSDIQQQGQEEVFEVAEGMEKVGEKGLDQTPIEA